MPSLEPFFSDVQLSGIFEDSKTFADALPKADIKIILEAYLKKKNNPNFNLLDFVKDHFVLPQPPNVTNLQHGLKPTQHAKALWPILTRTTQTPGVFKVTLPFPYVVPGGRFGEMYYWDSYFTMLGLKQSGEDQLLIDMVGNFAYIIDQLGFVPNGTRDYFLSRSQPPFFVLMLDLLPADYFDLHKAYLLGCLEKEYDFWMSNRSVRLKDDLILNRYDDAASEPRPESYREDVALALNAENKPLLFRNIRAACESGWDFSSRWLANRVDLATIHTIDFIPVDLNCLIWKIEEVLGASKLEKAKIYAEKAQKRIGLINDYFWNEDLKSYCDFDLSSEKQSEKITAAAAYPLFFKLASPKQALSQAHTLEKYLVSAAGLMTTDQNSGQQWDAPNCWAPLQWMAYIGLKNYGFDALAEQIKINWTSTVEAVFEKEGKFTEKYTAHSANASGGEYPNQDGFGWTNGVYLAMKAII